MDAVNQHFDHLEDTLKQYDLLNSPSILGYMMFMRLGLDARHRRIKKFSNREVLRNDSCSVRK